MKCIYCRHHEFKDKRGKPSDHAHWCGNYNATCNSAQKRCKTENPDYWKTRKLENKNANGGKKYFMANSIYLDGTLVRDPNFRYTPRGTAVCTFTVENLYSYKDSDNERESESYEFDIETWGKLADRCGNLLRKGFAVEINGRLKQNRWNDPQGMPHSRIIIVANSVNVKGR